MAHCALCLLAQVEQAREACKTRFPQAQVRRGPLHAGRVHSSQLLASLALATSALCMWWHVFREQPAPFPSLRPVLLVPLLESRQK